MKNNMPTDPVEPLPQIHIPGVSNDSTDPVTIVHHVFILDASGSMLPLRNATISGFNEQVQNIRQLEQQYPNQRNLVSLVFFNRAEDVRFFDASSSSLQEITALDYNPNGSTNLYATIGKIVTRLKNELGDRCSTERVIITIMTDGENTDYEAPWTQSAARELLQQVQADHRWVVTFIGANIDVEQAAADLSIPVSNSVRYAANAGNTASAFRLASQSRTAFMARLANSQGAVGATDAYYSTDTSRGVDLTAGTPQMQDQLFDPQQSLQIDRQTMDSLLRELQRQRANTPPRPPASPVTP